MGTCKKGTIKHEKLMKLLVIGGTGVLSGAVVNEAIRNRIDVTIVVRGTKKTIVPEGVKIIQADYRNSPLMETALKDKHFDAVIDFICYNKDQIAYSIDLLHSVADQYIFISTTCVYDTSISGIKTEESKKVLSDWNYSVNKWACECLLRDKASELNFNYSIIRPCVTYDDTRIPYGVMPPYGYHWTMCARILAGKPIIRWDKGTTRWNMMRVEDFAVGVVGIIGNKQAYNEAYNLSGDNAYEWNDVISIVEDYLGKKAVICDMTSSEYKAFYPKRSGEIAGRSLDAIISNRKIKALVPSYNTSCSLHKGLFKTLDAYKKQNYQKGIDWEYDANLDLIISLYCRKHKIDRSVYKLNFVDYLGTATLSDKKRYWMESHNNFIFVKLIRKTSKIVSRLTK